MTQVFLTGQTNTTRLLGSLLLLSLGLFFSVLPFEAGIGRGDMNQMALKTTLPPDLLGQSLHHLRIN